MPTTREQYDAEVAAKQRKQQQQDEAEVRVQVAQDRWREGKGSSRAVAARRLNPYGDAAREAGHERLNASIRTQQAAEAEAARAAAEASPGGVADSIRARGNDNARAGLALLSESGRQRAVKVRNPTHQAVKGYTDAMLGEAPVRRKDRFDRERVARARAGLASLSGTPATEAQPPASSTATSSPGTRDERLARARAGLASLSPAAPAAAPPVQVVIQQPGAAPPLPAEPIPLEDVVPPEQETPPEPTLEELEADQLAREGILQQQLDAAVEHKDAVAGVANAKAEALADASAQFQVALGQAAAAKADQDARVRVQLEASQEANRLVQRTAKEAIDAAAIDPKRAWSTMGTGRKVAFVLSAIAGGIAGSSDPMQYVNKYIDQDIEQQRQGLAKAEANVGTAQAAAAEQDNLYQRTLASVGDERVTADVVRAARLEQIQADLQARLSKAGTRQVSAEQEVFLTKLQEELVGSPGTELEFAL